MPRKQGNPWLRFDVQTYADAKVRLGRCGAVWPWCLATLKRCGGSVTDEDLDPMLAAADLCIPLELATEQLAGVKRVGLLVDDGDGGWTTKNWRLYQPDPRKRSDRRDPDGPRDTQGHPGTPRGIATGPRESTDGPRGSRSDPAYGTGRDETRPDKEQQQRAGAREARPSAPDSDAQPAPSSPDLAEQGERIAATLTALESDPAIAEKREAFADLCDALNRRGGLSAAMQGRLADLLMPEDPQTLWRLASLLGDSMAHIKNPVGYITTRRREPGGAGAAPSMLDEARQYARDLARIKPIDYRDNMTPEQRAFYAKQAEIDANDPNRELFKRKWAEILGDGP